MQVSTIQPGYTEVEWLGVEPSAYSVSIPTQLPPLLGTGND